MNHFGNSCENWQSDMPMRVPDKIGADVTRGEAAAEADWFTGEVGEKIKLDSVVNSYSTIKRYIGFERLH